MSDSYSTLKGVYQEVWDCVVEGIGRANHPAHTPTLVTVSPKNWPEARSVVMRAVDIDAATIAFYTDIDSDKVRSLRHAPRAAIHIWDPQRQLQIRMHMHVSISSGAEVRMIWERLPEHSKTNYGVVPAPGQPIKAADAYTKRPNPNSFAVINCNVLTIDAVHLGEPHRRAIYSRSDDWMGHWLSP